MGYKPGTRLYVNADRTRIVPEGSAEAAYLLVGAGGELTDDQARHYGLVPETHGKASAKAQEPAKNKAVTKAPANKGA